MAPSGPALSRSRLLAITLSLPLSALSACGSDDLKGPAAEVVETNVELDLPAVPEFQIPSPNPDGSHSVAEMRLKSPSFMKQEVTITGHVLWIYSCAEDIGSPEMTEKQVAELISQHPEKCKVPQFVLGDTTEDKLERGVQVVEIPRELRKDEIKNMPDELLAEKKAALAAMPPFKVGDQVSVTGMWDDRSPRGYYNSSGLLTYGSMKNLSSGE